MTQIIMLPTDKEPITGDLLLRHLWKNDPNECKSLWQYKETVVIGDVKQYTVLNGSFRDYYKNFKVQHLYEVSEDKIQRGDYFISFNEDESYLEITLNDQVDDFHDWADIEWTENCKKVVKTTDKDLQLPTFSEDFLAHYIENFAKENPKTFKIVKNSWSKEELRAVAYEFFKRGIAQGRGDMSDSRDCNNQTIDKFIEKL